MHIIINNSSMVPIYEQIVNQIKTAIVNGELLPETVLPSVRGMAKELKISALTVKKAYDYLEEEGLTITIHGKGTFVASAGTELLKEEHIRQVEEDLEKVIDKGQCCGLNQEELREMFEMIVSDKFKE